jgi:hypothetical protein
MVADVSRVLLGSFNHEVHEGHEEVLDLFVQLRALRALRGEYLGFEGLVLSQ